MSKAVFISSTHSAYDDRPGEAYHFPNSYLSRVAQTVGDWVIFYQGRRGGVSGYYSVQRVERIVPDPADATHSYVMLDRASLLDFERPVPRFRPTGTPYETGLPIARGSNASAVRIISDADFAAIIDDGLREDATPDTLPREGPLLRDPVRPGFAEAVAGFVPLGSSDRLQVLASRALRDRTFARQVKAAYRARCAMSGLELRNGGGRPEVEAAHIVPVEARGPDTVRNGIALSGTIHWMFDRGLVSVDDDMRLLIARDSVASEIATRLFVPDRRLILPDDPAKAPHQSYLRWHRTNCFKG
ncbi:MAG: HNH endonuclease [Tabrizicola sp.]|jgi:putative restriction endonuclease|uniref:HNH endonuclease n=1 Tax=Tabrizicola sp. TaxID=2005166 RepID=UPI001B3CC088|nr:HNH endonuclease [Tabrizicola sp.]